MMGTPISSIFIWAILMIRVKKKELFWTRYSALIQTILVLLYGNTSIIVSNEKKKLFYLALRLPYDYLLYTIFFLISVTLIFLLLSEYGHTSKGARLIGLLSFVSLIFSAGLVIAWPGSELGLLAGFIIVIKLLLPICAALIQSSWSEFKGKYSTNEFLGIEVPEPRKPTLRDVLWILMEASSQDAWASPDSALMNFVHYIFQEATKELVE
jgi:hypothetical protein